MNPTGSVTAGAIWGKRILAFVAFNALRLPAPGVCFCCGLHPQYQTLLSLEPDPRSVCLNSIHPSQKC